MKIRTMIEGLLLAALLVGWYYMKRLERSRDEMLGQVRFLASHLDVQVTLNGNLMQELRKTKDGRVKSTTRFVPPEGRVTVAIPEDKTATPKIIVDSSGLTFRPGIGISYSGKMRVSASTKVFFWGRYGVVGNVERSGVYGGVSRYVDDLIPFWHPRNLELFIAYRLLTFTEEPAKLKIGMRLSL